MVFRLNDELWFPDPYGGEPDGLIAVGGDLSVERLRLAYSYGIFPWYSFRDRPEPRWYCPLDRFVIFPAEIHVSHSMRTLINSGRFSVSINHDFDRVIDHCSQLRVDQDGAWLGPEMVEAYKRMHKSGFAASVEVWDGDSLMGGLYGVTLGRAFFGESMFSLAPGASKLALIALSRYMQEHGGSMIDCQFETPHLLSMGGRHIAYDEYMTIVSGDFTAGAEEAE